MLVSLTGPSGVGKGYLKTKIRGAFPMLSELVWLTTRSLRHDEIGSVVNRRSISSDKLDVLRAQNKLAYEQSLYGQNYAITFDEIERARNSHCITEAHVNTLPALKQLVPGLVALAIIPTETRLLHKRLLVNRAAGWNEDTQKRLVASEQEVLQIKEGLPDFALVVEVDDENEAASEAIVMRFLAEQLNSQEKRK